MSTGHTHAYVYRGLEISVHARQIETRREWSVSVTVREVKGGTLFERRNTRSRFTSLALANHAGMTLGEEFADEWHDRGGD